MKKEVKKKEKYVTEKTFNKFEDRFNKFEYRFESSARATAKSFADNAENMAKSFADNATVMALILKEIKTIHEDNKYFRQSISSLNIDGFSYDRRIKKLEEKVK